MVSKYFKKRRNMGVKFNLYSFLLLSVFIGVFGVIYLKWIYKLDFLIFDWLMVTFFKLKYLLYENERENMEIENRFLEEVIYLYILLGLNV